MRNVKVMVVDDSLVFRSQIKNCLSDVDGLEVVNMAKNGAVALDFLRKNEVDLITLDLEMPMMDGIALLKEMGNLNRQPKVIVFSANTTKGAQKTLEAMRLGAVDVVCKPQQDPDSKVSIRDRIGAELLPKIEPFIEMAARTPAPESAPQAAAPRPKSKRSLFSPRAVVVGCSTGGPVALERLFASLPSTLSAPIVIAQHMPPLFTASLAKRLALVTGKTVKEAEHGEPIAKDIIYIAPGDHHLEVSGGSGGKENFVLSQKEKRNSVRPAVDFLFESAAELWGKEALGFVLTGMGADGKDGCRALKASGGTVIIQDKATSVVWGMPGAVHLAGDYDEVMAIDDCASALYCYLCHDAPAARTVA